MVVNHNCVGWMLHQKPALLRKRRQTFLNKTWEWGTEVALRVKPVFDLKRKARLRRDQLVPLRETVACFSFTVYLKHRDPPLGRVAPPVMDRCHDTVQKRGSMIWSPHDSASETFPICFLHPNICLPYFLTLKGIPRRNSSLQIPSSPLPQPHQWATNSIPSVEWFVTKVREHRPNTAFLSLMCGGNAGFEMYQAPKELIQE